MQILYRLLSVIYDYNRDRILVEPALKLRVIRVASYTTEIESRLYVHYESYTRDIAFG